MAVNRRQSLNSNINRWLYNGGDEIETQNQKPLAMNVLRRASEVIPTTRKPVSPLTVSTAREMVVCGETPSICSGERRSSIIENTLVTIEQKQQEITKPPPIELNISNFSAITQQKPSSSAKVGLRRNSISADPKILWEKRLAETQAKEKQAQMQINELQRKIVSLEDRIRAVRNEKRRTEKRTQDNLDAKIIQAVARVVKDKELDIELKEKIADAVAAAVAQTLLTYAAPVAPPKRAPPSAQSNRTVQLAQI
jgi:hypothetical protein